MDTMNKLDFKKDASTSKAVSYNNSRRVTKQAIVLPPKHNTQNDDVLHFQLLAADSLYGGNIMDGKLKILSVIIQKHDEKEDQQDQVDYQNIIEIVENDSIDTKIGVTSIEYLHFQQDSEGKKIEKEFVVFGQENGSIKLRDISSRCFPNNQSDIFMVKTSSNNNQNQSDHDIQDDNLASSSSHTNSITCIKKNPYHHQIFASASRDGSVAIWNLCANDQEFLFDLSQLDDSKTEQKSGSQNWLKEGENCKMKQVLFIKSNQLPKSDQQPSEQFSSVNSLDWISSSKLVIAQSNGMLSMIDLSNRDADACLDYFKYDSIWSVKVIDPYNIAVSCESGVYICYNESNDMNNAKFVKKIASQQINQSSFHVSISQHLDSNQNASQLNYLVCSFGDVIRIVELAKKNENTKELEPTQVFKVSIKNKSQQSQDLIAFSQIICHNKRIILLYACYNGQLYVKYLN